MNVRIMKSSCVSVCAMQEPWKAGGFILSAKLLRREGKASLQSSSSVIVVFLLYGQSSIPFLGYFELMSSGFYYFISRCLLFNMWDLVDLCLFPLTWCDLLRVCVRRRERACSGRFSSARTPQDADPKTWAALLDVHHLPQKESWIHSWRLQPVYSLVAKQCLAK